MDTATKAGIDAATVKKEKEDESKEKEDERQEIYIPSDKRQQIIDDLR